MSRRVHQGLSDAGSSGVKDAGEGSGGGSGGSVTWPLLADGGSLEAPSYSFADSSNTGWFLYSGSGVQLRCAVEGQLALAILSTSVQPAKTLYPTTNGTLDFGTSSRPWKDGYINRVLTGGGTLAAPDVALGADVDTGVLIESGNVQLVTAGSRRIQVSTSGLEVVAACVPTITNYAYLGSNGRAWKQCQAHDFVLVEEADHNYTAAAGKGIVWLRDDAPAQLIYTDDDGNDYDLTPRYARIAETGNATAQSVNDGPNLPEGWIPQASATEQADASGTLTFDQGAQVAATGVFDAGGGTITVVTGSVHGLAVGDPVVQSGFTVAGYNGIYVVTAVPTTTQYQVTETYVSTDNGVVTRPAWLLVGDGAAGDYDVRVAMTTTASTSNDSFAAWLYIDGDVVATSKQARKHGSSGDKGNWGISDILTLAEGERLWLAFVNESGSGDITFRNFNLSAKRLG